MYCGQRMCIRKINCVEMSESALVNLLARPKRHVQTKIHVWKVPSVPKAFEVGMTLLNFHRKTLLSFQKNLI